MTTTSASLLGRLRGGHPAASDWRRRHDLYGPLVRSWLARVPGLGAEADDLAQEVLVVLVRELPAFERRRAGSFRCWLRAVTANRVRSWRRARQRVPFAGLDPADDFLARLEDPAGDLALQWDREYDRHVFDRLLAAVRPDFEPLTWQAFESFAVGGQKAAGVAAEPGTTAAAVVQAKARVLKRLRQEAAGLLESFRADSRHPAPVAGLVRESAPVRTLEGNP